MRPKLKSWHGPLLVVYFTATLPIAIVMGSQCPMILIVWLLAFPIWLIATIESILWFVRKLDS